MVTLRPLTSKDLGFLLEVRNDPTTRHFLEDNSIFSLNECKKWFKTKKPIWFIIEVDKKSVGYVRTKKDEIGVDIHPKFRRKGYARASYKKYLQDKNFASLWVFEDNFARNLYIDLGFKDTGETQINRGRLEYRMEWKKKN